MSVTTTSPTKVIINNDFSILVPAGMIYSSDPKEIQSELEESQNRFFTFIKKEKNAYYKSKHFDPCSLSNPYSAPQSLVMMQQLPYKPCVGTRLTRADQQIIELYHQRLETPTPCFVKTSDTIITSFSPRNLGLVQMGILDSPPYMVTIATPTSLYCGSAMICDREGMEEQSEVIIDWLNSVEKA